MNPSYTLLIFVAVVVLVLVGWVVYVQFTAAPEPLTTQPTTQPLVERLRDERERRMRVRDQAPAPTTATIPSL